MKQIIIDQIKVAIKAQKWDKFSYGYALKDLDYYNPMSMFPEQYKKNELISKFYELIETRFNRIKNYTTFKDIQL